MWPNARLTKLFGIEHPIVLAPMAGAMDFELVAAVSAAGGLGSLPCAMLTPDALRDQLAKVRARTDRPVNVNFFCHTPPVPNNAREARWRDQLKPYYKELGIDPALPVPSSNRMPFEAARCIVDILASGQCMKALPICTPAAPSAKAAAMPRASAMPPAAITGTATASTIWGTRARCRPGPQYPR